MNRLLPILATAAIAGTAACGAEVERQLLIPEDVELLWTDAFNRVDDGLGAFVPVDLMVYDGASGDPVDGVSLDLQTSHESIGLVSVDEVTVAEAADCGDCAMVWDSVGDRNLVVEQLDSWPATERTVRTDAGGVVRLYVYVDSFPTEGAEFLPVAVTVSSEVQDDAFSLLPR